MPKTTKFTPERLLSMPETTFRRLVDADVRKKGTEEVAESLRSPQVVRRWLSALTAMAKSVEGQLAAREADLEVLQLEYEKASRGASEAELAKLEAEYLSAQTREATWRASVLRFKTGLDEAITEAKQVQDAALATMFDLAVIAERNHALERIQVLEEAIRLHRDHNCSNEPRCSYSSCVADTDLWKHVPDHAYQS